MPAWFHSLDLTLRRWLARRGRVAQWAVLLALSAAGSVALEAVDVPAALLIGPMAAAILLSLGEGRVRVPKRLFHAAQGVVGCLIARGLPASIFGELRHDWLLFAGVIAAVIATSATLGTLLARWQVLPGTTAIWGSSPGGATAMTLMAEAYGADIRLVAFMQYLRVVFVVVLASFVAALWSVNTHAGPGTVWFPALDWVSFGETLAVAAAGIAIGRGFSIPAGPLLIPMAVGVVLQDLGLLTITLPPWLLAISYALVGWSIGLRFSRGILAHAARAFPRVAAALLVLVALCGCLAVLLVLVAGVDPLSAYLATSPGGADSVAIIAASTHVDVPFVMAMQACRMVVVLAVGPSLTRFIAARLRRKTGAPL